MIFFDFASMRAASSSMSFMSPYVPHAVLPLFSSLTIQGICGPVDGRYINLTPFSPIVAQASNLNERDSRSFRKTCRTASFEEQMLFNIYRQYKENFMILLVNKGKSFLASFAKESEKVFVTLHGFPKEGRPEKNRIIGLYCLCLAGRAVR